MITLVSIVTRNSIKKETCTHTKKISYKYGERLLNFYIVLLVSAINLKPGEKADNQA